MTFHDDVWYCILKLLFDMLRDDDNNNDGSDSSLFAYHYATLPLVSCQWLRIVRRPEFIPDTHWWLAYLNRFHYLYAIEVDTTRNDLINDTPEAEISINMGRTLAFYNQEERVTRRELDLFIDSNHIVYHTPSGRIYRGRVVIDKLKRIKVKPKATALQYQGIIKRHDNAHQKYLLLSKKLKTRLKKRGLSILGGVRRIVHY
jgi:hypothetical protein